MPWAIVPGPGTGTHRIGRAEALLFFSSESLLNVLSQKRGRTARWIRILGHGIGWGLPGSTNSYANSYTIRATENANRFSCATACSFVRTGSGSDGLILT